jgi:hypothetical protein
VRNANRPSVTRHPSFLLVALAALGCSAGIALENPSGAAPEVTPISGKYQVNGTTTDDTTGAERRVQGVVIVVRDGAHYTTHFELTSLLPGSMPVPTRVVGAGDGHVVGSSLIGTADFWMLSSTVAGVDVDFPFIPRRTSQTIHASSVAEVGPDGLVHIEIQNSGDEYAPTHTVLEGQRVGDARPKLAMR